MVRRKTPYYFDDDNFGRERLFHDCPIRGSRQLCPSPGTVEKLKYYEDGYFRGIVKGRASRMFKGSPYPYNVIRCKSCGNDYTWEKQR